MITGWLAGLIVAVIYGAIAGGLALQGKRKVKARAPPVPEQAVQSVNARSSVNQATRQGGPAMTADVPGNGADAGETKSPEQIRADIEQTREQLGDTVEALAEKTDVKAQAKNRIAAVKDAAQTKRDE